MVSLTDEQKEYLEAEAFDQGTRVAQIFSGIFFSGLAAWLTVTNGTKLAFVQRAALEKRLTVCCFLNTYVGFFSAFFNFFQLTTVDDLMLPATENFTLDLARPIEWICTCPLMQLSLVLMGGAKIPEYRRYMMPMFSAIILVLGTASAFMPIMALKILCYALGVVVFGTMVFFNRQQILEYSSGEEGLLTGDSEFRKATLLLVATWMPFPTWFIVSPEGFGFIDNILIVQVGWAFLNIVAKFVFIFYIQRIKDLYCNRLKTKRELTGSKMHGIFGGGGSGRPGSVSPSPRLDRLDDDHGGGVEFDSALAYEQADADRKKGQLSAVVVETMSFLGMAQHTERFLRLLDRANMSSISEVESLTKENCDELQLPYDLVSALQRRLRVWKLEMVDDAEMGLDRGEEHYLRKGMLNKVDMPHAMYDGMGVDGEILEGMLRKTETHILQGQNLQLWESALKGVNSELQTSLNGLEQRMLEQIETVTKTAEQRGEARAFETRLNSRLDDLATTNGMKTEVAGIEKRLTQAFEQHLALMATKVDLCCQKVEAINQKVDVCSQKVDACHATDLHLQGENMEKLKEHLDTAREETKKGLKAVQQSGEAAQAAILQQVEATQALTQKQAAEGTQGWRAKIEELEAWLVQRRDEQKAEDRHRFEEVMTHFSKTSKNLDDLSTQVQKTSDRGEATLQQVSTSLNGEVQSSATKVLTKVEGLFIGAAKQHSDFEATVQSRLEELISGQTGTSSSQKMMLETAFRTEKAVEALDTNLHQHVQRVVEQAATSSAVRAERAVENASEKICGVVSQGTQRTERAVEAIDHGLVKRLVNAATESMSECAEKGAQMAASRAQKAVEILDDCLQKRLDDAVARAAESSAFTGASQASRGAEKAIEALEGSQRNELHTAIANLLERIDDLNTVQGRKAAEREERAARRVEEIMDLASNRTGQKVEDVGLDLKKELHGFAKRLNSKIPFM